MTETVTGCRAKVDSKERGEKKAVWKGSEKSKLREYDAWKSEDEVKRGN